ncbi:hypothetical protein CQA49_08980 [Helicobacter sp. MIT 00-7814]|uniref:hypothetical protein n=1 Tax=unclassified Helicobacter TaxID=2593540 RepID=UPI000E1E7590|nr:MULTISPECIES: hypothetical protein [unclassified Helicobacter]RDU51962.1 hypothetical protein CQA49_08980 [Helicobacter sp. MIT 00-7814]RDU54132.1 hypothetical protein CQA37_05835 [Helicobacter sp. MIT 99-10781]
MKTTKFEKAGNLDLVKAFVLYVICSDNGADGEYSVFVGATLKEAKDFAKKHLSIPISTWRQDGEKTHITTVSVGERKQPKSFKSKGLDVRDVEIYEELLIKQGSKLSRFRKERVVQFALD